MTRAVLVLLFAAGLAQAQPPISVPPRVDGGVAAFIEVKAETAGKLVRWRAVDPGLNVFPAHLLRVTTSTVVSAAQPGQYRLWAWTAIDGVPSEAVECVVVVGAAPPTPPGPTPPGPTPPQPPPQPVTGMRVLIVEETADRSKLPAAQLAVLFDRRVRDYLAAKTATETLPDGRTWKAYRIYDPHLDISGDLPHWREMIARARAVTPWIVITDGAGTVVHEGPLPGTVEATLTVLKQYGG
jgi:hypothetical protein